MLNSQYGDYIMRLQFLANPRDEFDQHRAQFANVLGFGLQELLLGSGKEQFEFAFKI